MTKKMISPADQEARDENAKPAPASNVDDLTQAKLDLLSTVSSAPVYFTPAEPEQEHIDNLESWQDSDLKFYDRNFKNVILARIAGTSELITKDGEREANVKMKHDTGIVTGMEAVGPNKRLKEKTELLYFGGNLHTINLMELAENDPFGIMSPTKSGADKTIEMNVHFFEVHHDFVLWCDIHGKSSNGKRVVKTDRVTLTPGGDGKPRKVFAAGVERFPDTDEGKMRTRAWWVAHLADFNWEDHVEKILKLDAQSKTNNARLPRSSEGVRF